MRIQVNGVVQGVGFRPVVWNLAKQLQLTGSVWNGADGVTIELWGAPTALEQFLQRLQQNPPPLAIIDQLTTAALEGDPPAEFTITQSREGHITTGVAADAATCPDCLEEIRNPQNRRYRYPFTNCTHCGPRLSIIHSVPYDRPNTSMAPFTLCPQCRQEYEDPADRRFHAQPNCCPDCGPQLWLEDRQQNPLEGDPIEQAAQRIQQGKIVAIKGVGGIHLACDATSEQAVDTLRQRKLRPTKALAVMVRDLTQAQRYAALTPAEAELLQSRAAPIVIVQQGPETLASAIAPLQQSIGIMLPYSPLHHLLLAAVGSPIVLTSGNRSGEPQCISNQAARSDLAAIAD
jgi:hydrogenase maturation protein HypF